MPSDADEVGDDEAYEGKEALCYKVLSDPAAEDLVGGSSAEDSGSETMVVKEALHYTVLSDPAAEDLSGSSIVKDSSGDSMVPLILCGLCPRGCRIPPGASGYCGTRRHRLLTTEQRPAPAAEQKPVPATEQKPIPATEQRPIPATERRPAPAIEQRSVLLAESYGRVTGYALDPIEKKPLYRFYPHSRILSVGSYGCNLHCDFCQNHHISQETPCWSYLSPEQLVQEAISTPGNLGVAFTYNEPLLSYEYILDTAVLLHRAGLKVVLVSNGIINPEPFAALLPHIDAMNIDLKGFGEDWYRRLGGSLTWVQMIIPMAYAACHLEVTTLVVPGENDSAEEMDRLASWLATSCSPQVPLHLSRFFPRYRMLHKVPTPLGTLQSLAEVARRHLQYVYLGNV